MNVSANVTPVKIFTSPIVQSSPHVKVPFVYPGSCIVVVGICHGVLDETSGLALGATLATLFPITVELPIYVGRPNTKNADPTIKKTINNDNIVFLLIIKSAWDYRL